MTTDAKLNPHEEIKNTGKGDDVKRRGGTVSASYKGKEACVRRLHLYHSNYVTFWKRQNMETVKR